MATTAPSAPLAVAQAGSNDLPYKFTGRVPFPTADAATVACNTLAVDPELRSDQVARKLYVDGSVLVVDFEAVDMRVLRGAVSSMYDLLALATRTMERFGDDSLGMMAHQQPQPPAEEQRP